MNWRLKKLDPFILVSNSDAHSASKLGREANIFDCEFSYDGMYRALADKNDKGFVSTIEFFPEEGKYHFDGHRGCGIVFDPKTSREHQCVCPKCGKKLTIGVMHRVEDLADRKEGSCPPQKIPFKCMIPLEEIIADTFGIGVGTKTVAREYEKMIQSIGPEFEILFEKTLEEMRPVADPRVIDAILKVRKGQVRIEPGYDGVYGKIKVVGPAPLQKDLFGTA